MRTRTIPILPCPSIDPVQEFYEALGFTVISKQTRPYGYLAACASSS
ncbi:hypothetical protein AB0B45_48805 [Nonomuraea sp. NPDC049152]